MNAKILIIDDDKDILQFVRMNLELEGLDVVTADFCYGRLIGDRKAVDAKTETFDRIVIDQGERLDRWASLLRQLLDAVPEAYVYANNHYAGHGPASIRDLVARVNG